MKTYIIFFTLILLFNGCPAQNSKINNIDSCKGAIIAQGYEIGFILSNRYIIHGYVDKVNSTNLKQLSTTLVLDCQTGENIVGKLFCVEKENYSFCLPFVTKIEKTDANINIIHYGSLPYGKNWGFVDVPVYKQSLKFDKDSIYKTEGECILKPKEISKEQSIEVVKEYKNLKSKGKELFNNQDGIDTFSLIILKLFMCSLEDYSECKDIFLNLEDNFPGSTDGIFGEIYWQWFGFYHLYKKQPLPERIGKN